jgi:hypothetical protein
MTEGIRKKQGVGIRHRQGWGLDIDMRGLDIEKGVGIGQWQRGIGIDFYCNSVILKEKKLNQCTIII